MKIQARTIDELIEKSGPHAPALRELDALIVAAAPALERRLFSGPSITMIGYGELVAAAAVQLRIYGRDCARPVEGRSKARPGAPTSKGPHRR